MPPSSSRDSKPPAWWSSPACSTSAVGARTEDPIAIVARLAGSSPTVAIGDKTWSRFLVALIDQMPSATRFRTATEVTGPIRARKTADEIARLQAAATGVDRIAARLQAGEIPLVGRTEAAVAADLAARSTTKVITG